MSSLNKVHWEVVLTFSWGTQSRQTYKTREDARKGRKFSIENHTNTLTGEIHNYIVKIELFKVTHMAGLSSMSGDGVYVYKKSR